MNEIPPRLESVSATLHARFLRENIRNLAEASGEDTKTTLEMGPDGLRLHTLDMSEWIHPTDITIGPLPLAEAPAVQATISIDVKDLALWAEHQGNEFLDDVICLTAEPAAGYRPGETLTCYSTLDKTTLRLGGDGWRHQSGNEDAASPDTQPEPNNDRQLAIHTKCLIKLLSRGVDILPGDAETENQPIRLKTTICHDGESEQLEIACAGRYTYLIQTKRLKSQGARNMTMYIPSTTARTFLKLTRGRRSLHLGETIVTRDSIQAIPPKPLGEMEITDTPVTLRWESAHRCEGRFPKLDELRMSHNGTPSVTLHLQAHETARFLGLICRVLESRKKPETRSYGAQNEFIIWDFKNDEVRALDDQMRIPLNRLCAVHNRPAYRDAPPLELNAPRLRRLVDFWTRHHGPGSTPVHHLPVEYLMTAQRIRIATTGADGRTTETVLQCSLKR